MATAEKELTTAYQLVIAGPAVVTLEIGPAALLHMASSSPAANAPAHRLVRGTDRESFTYNGSLNIYAKKRDDSGVNTVLIAYTG